EASFGDSVPLKAQGKSSLSNLKVDANGNTNEILARTTAAVEAAYEGGDEHDDVLSMKTDFSDFDLQALAMEKRELAYPVLFVQRSSSSKWRWRSTWHSRQPIICNDLLQC
ncbi:leucine rich repeat domain containing protein, partial [Musa troglodytarum]